MPRRKRADFTYKPYDPTFHPHNLIVLMSQRLTNAQVAMAWGLSADTLNRWRREHSELEEAYQQGLTYYEAKFTEEVMNPMIEGKLEGRHSFNAARFVARNKLGWVDGGSSGETRNTQINISQTNINANKSIEELKTDLQKDLQYLFDNQVITPDNTINVTEAEFKVITHESKSDGEE